MNGNKGMRFKSQGNLMLDAGTLKSLRIRHVSAVVLFLFLAFLFFGTPLAGHLTHRYVGQGEDPIQYVDAMLWWPWALLHGHNALFDHWLWAPFGQPLLWVTSVPSISLLMTPITFSVGPIASYNLAMIGAPALSAIAMYWLLAEVTPNFWIQVFGGYVFGFSSYEIGETLGHLHLTWTFPIPLLLLIAIRSYRLHRVGIKVPFSYRVATVLIALFLFGVSVEIFTTFSFFSAVFIIITWLTVRRSPVDDQDSQTQRRVLSTTLRWVGISYGVVVALLLPLGILMLIHPLYSGYPNSPSIFSADLLNFVVPTGVTVGGSLVSGVAHTFTGNWSEQGAYLGLPLIALSCVAIRRGWKNVWIKVLTIMGFVVIIASLGPQLHVAGLAVMPLPWAIFEHIPLLGDVLPTRMTMYVPLIAVLLIAVGFAQPAPLSQRSSATYFALGGLSILFLLPNLGLGQGFWWSSISVSRLFTTPNRLRRVIPPGSTVMMFPYGSYGDAVLTQVASRFEFRLANGYFGEMPKAVSRWPIAETLWNSSSMPRGHYFAIQLAGLVAQQKATRIVALKGYRASVGELISTIRGIHVLYRGDGMKVWSVGRDEFKTYGGGLQATLARAQLMQFTSLYQAAYVWLGKHPLSVANLAPQLLEARGALSPTFGGNARTQPSWNWTGQGGWLGPWANGLFGVGVTGTGEEVNGIIQHYKRAALQIYFPYPHVLTQTNARSIRRLPPGELAMTFAPSESFYATQFSNLNVAAHKWLADHLPITTLSPLAMENLGFLNRQYGGYPRTQPNWQWTQYGGWVGSWKVASKNSLAIGLYGPWARLKPIFTKYGGKAEQVFFPYPERLGNATDATKRVGELVMVYPSH